MAVICIKLNPKISTDFNTEWDVLCDMMVSRHVGEVAERFKAADC
ncbi:MAG: hypothetical protein AB4041_01580 [Microcystaceae cyanobacterium]